MKFIYDRDKTAVIFKDKRYSYYDIIKISKIYATYLNIKKEERVAVFMENRPEYVCAILSIWEKKGTSTNLDVSYTPEQLAYVFKDSTPTYIFTSKQHYETISEAIKLSKIDVHIIDIDKININIDIDIQDVSIEYLENDAVAVMLYTSGTTGEPKGVMLTFGNIMSNINAIKLIDFISPEDKILAMLPFHHILPLVLSMFMPLNYGGLMVILDELSSEAIKRNLQKYQITVVIGVPRIWEMFHKGILNKIKSSSLAYKLFKLCQKLNIISLNRIVFKKIQDGFGGHIKVLISGGAKLDTQISKDFATFGFKMLEGYGLTETSPIVAFNRPDDIMPGTVGVPIPGVKVKLEPDGEIVVKGPNVMKGYYKNKTATDKVIDADGWFHTGDLGEFNGDYLKIVGRKKEMIVLSNGKNINPSDVESEIMKETNLIEEVAVAEHNKHLIALIYPNFKTLEKRKILNIKEAIKWDVIDRYNISAPNYRKILDILIMKEELPKTKLGKIRRFMLPDIINKIYLGKNQKISQVDVSETDSSKTLQQSDLNKMNSEEFKEIAKFITTLTDNATITPESHLELDLGLDSLDMVEIISFIETTFGLNIKENEFIKIKTVKQLCEYIRINNGEFEKKEVNWQSIFNEPVDLKIPSSKLLNIFINVFKPFFKLYVKLNKDITKLSSETSVIYVGNHQSMLDAFAFSQILPKNISNNTYFIAINIHFEGKIKKYLAENTNIILIDINKNLKETLKIAAKILKNGKNLVIFPEGARTRDGQLQEFKKTFAILSKELNIPIVPFAIKGAYDLMPYGKKFPSKGAMKITILDTIYPKNKSVDDIVELTKDTISKNL